MNIKKKGIVLLSIILIGLIIICYYIFNYDTKKSIAAEPQSLQSLQVNTPNSFAARSNGGLYLADTYTGLHVVNLEKNIPTIETVKIGENIDFRLPAALCIYSGKIFVADYRNNRIVVLNENNGERISEWCHTEMMDPEGIAADRFGNIYVASYGNGKILKFDQEGNLICTWTNSSFDEKQKLVHPHGIFIKDNSVYVTELMGDIAVLVYDLNGNLLRKFGNSNGSWKLKYPTSVWVYKNNVLVADAVAHQVKVFNCDGVFLRSLGKYGLGEGQFFYPYGVGVDSKGIIYVGDTKNNRVQFFSWEGNFLGKISANNETNIDSYFKSEEGLEELSVNYTVKDLNATDIEITDEGTYLLNSYSGKLEQIDNEEKRVTILKGLNYPWSISEDVNNSLWVNDEPGNLTLYQGENKAAKYSISLTSLQFDPVEPILAWIHRPQDVAVNNNLIAVANTVPGNVIIIDRYGSIKKLINMSTSYEETDPKLSKNSTAVLEKKRSVPTGIDFLDDKNIIVADMVGKALVINIESGETRILNTPIGFYQPRKVVCSSYKNLIAITEPHKNRLQFFDKNLNWLGYVTNQSVPELVEPTGITFNNEGDLFITCQGAEKILEITLQGYFNIKNIFLPSRDFLDIVAPVETNNISPFIKVYGGISKKALDFWDYYKTEDGIVKYDFNFSWLNFKVPVSAGYGNHVWLTGVVHYSLLNYYAWENTNNQLYKENFMNHVNWIMENAVNKENGTIVWPNEIQLSLETVPNGYISASAQAGTAAVLLRAAEINPANSETYKEFAYSALKALDCPLANGGCLTKIDNKDFYVEYPSTDNNIRSDILPFMWLMVFLKECGDMGQPYYDKALSFWNEIGVNKEININGYPYWPGQFGNEGVDLQTSKIVNKTLRSLSIN